MVPSRPISVTIRAADPDAFELLGQVDEVGAGRLGPALHGHLAAPGVEPDGHPAGVAGGQLGDELGPLDGGGADHDPGHAGVDQPLGGLDGADPAAGLDVAADAAGDGGHVLEVAGLAAAGGVEVDDVDPPGAGLLEGPGDRHRVVGVDGLGRVVAPQQPDGPPGPQVDGRVELSHTRRPRAKFLQQPQARWRRSSPGGTAWPTAGRCSTAATTGPPYSVVAATTASSVGNGGVGVDEVQPAAVVDAGEQRRTRPDRRRCSSPCGAAARLVTAGGGPRRG